jgi:thioredoxin reductase (NADPH)
MADHDVNSVAFPSLDESNLAALERCPKTVRKQFQAGHWLYNCGQADGKFYIVKHGELEMIDNSGEAPRTVAIHGPGGFTGEAGQLTGGPTIVGAFARTDCEVFEVTLDGLKEIVNKSTELGDIILQAFIARRQLLSEPGGVTGVRVIGSRYSQDTFRVRDFLAKNRVLFTWLDIEADPHVGQILEPFGVTEAETPLLLWGRKLILRNPTNHALAEALGIRRPLEHAVYDLVVVGAGPAGLAAAVYGASEGLRTMVLERSGPGGQAGRSMRIENYLGFPTGITGAELTARAVLQANKFGAQLPVPTPVITLTFENAYKVLHIDNGETVTAKCLLIATGAEYRRLGVDGCEPLEGRGVYYAATQNEASMCSGSEVLVVGGGNSAGQAAVFLSGKARMVYILIRGNDLYQNMSSYLARRIENTESIGILKNTEVRRMAGVGHLSEVEVVNNKTGEKRTIETPALFSFIGAVPRTEWLPSEIERDEKGFIRTGPTLPKSAQWTLRRHPFLLETTCPGVFAAGDVRSGSVKRVASAVGEGSMAVQFVHEYLKEI